MKKLDILNQANRKLNGLKFGIQKRSPEILVVIGVIGVVTSAVMACKASMEVKDVLLEAEEKKIDIEDNHKEGTEIEDIKKQVVAVNVETGMVIAKMYGPAILLGVCSISSIVASTSILRKRNVALAAAYATVDKSFKDYRNRVIDRFGETVENELRRDVTTKTVETVTVDEDGNEVVTKEDIDVVGLPSEYSRFFDQSCSAWEKDPEYNLMFLRAQQQYANNKLMATGRLFLNEVYDMLDMPRTKAGQVVGWVYDKNSCGDNYVDFNIYNCNRDSASNRFVNGYENVILLDFNVDGDIWSKMV